MRPGSNTNKIWKISTYFKLQTPAHITHHISKDPEDKFQRACPGAVESRGGKYPRQFHAVDSSSSSSGSSTPEPWSWSYPSFTDPPPIFRMHSHRPFSLLPFKNPFNLPSCSFLSSSLVFSSILVEPKRVPPPKRLEISQALQKESDRE